MTAPGAPAAPAAAYDLYIGGEAVGAASGERFGSFEPATRRLLAELPRAGPEDVDAAVAAARAAFDRGPWPRMSPAERAGVLDRAAERLRERAGALAELEVRDSGATIRKATAVDVPGAAAAFEWCAWWARRLGDREPAPARGGGRYLHWQPVGVVAAITPWNFPLLLAAWKIAPVLAAGNCCVVKPPSFASATTVELVRLLHDCDLPAGAVNVLTGPGATTGEALARHPGVDVVTLTGSDEIGDRLREVTAGSGTALRLELGGKSANVVLDDADLDLAAAGVLWSVFFHNGQICTAGSRLIAHERVHDRLLELLVERAGRLALGDPLEHATDLGPLISRQHVRGVARHVREATGAGARLCCGGASPDPVALPAGLDARAYFRPTILAGVGEDLPVAQREVFGPVLAVLRVASEEEALAVANGTRYRLAAAVWTGDPGRGARLAERLRADTVWVNDYRMVDITRPGGGGADGGADGGAGERHWQRLVNEIDGYRRRQQIAVVGGGTAGGRASRFDLLSRRG